MSKSKKVSFILATIFFILQLLIYVLGVVSFYYVNEALSNTTGDAAIGGLFLYLFIIIFLIYLPLVPAILGLICSIITLQETPKKIRIFSIVYAVFFSITLVVHVFLSIQFMF